MTLPPRLHLVLAFVLTLSACSDSGSAPPATGSLTPDSTPVGSATARPDSTSATDSAAVTRSEVTVEHFPDERCEANKAVGEIVFLSGYDYAAAASIIDVVRAEEAGYFDQMCLDVSIKPSFSIANYPLVAAGTAQISSGGSFAEIAAYANNTGGDFVVIGVDGNVPIDVLLMKPGQVADLTELAGQKIGVQGATPMPIAAMLADVGLQPDDYESVPLPGYDAVANFKPDELTGMTGYKSNEVGQLDAAAIEYEAFDPAERDIPGSFGAYYTSAEFAAQHPSAVEDFMRAALRGLHDAIEDPAAAIESSIKLAEAAGNPNYLTIDSETFRWAVESDLVVQSKREDKPLGMPDVVGLQAELDAYAPFGFFGDDAAPQAADLVDTSVVEGLYDGDMLIWPGNPDTKRSVETTSSSATAEESAISPQRCEQNKAAGKITFLTGFDFAAAASILEVITADARGFYEELCLDVELKPSFSTANYPLVASGQAQFASGGSFSETVAAAIATETQLRVVTVSGSEPIDTLLVKPEVGDELVDLKGTTIGVKGKLPPSIEVMLDNAGLQADVDYKTVPVEGFDPVAHMSYDQTVGVPGWRSNEPGRLEREGVPFIQYDSADAGVPGSFGVIFTSQDFIDEHPTATEDFILATQRGIEAMLIDPESAANEAIERIEAGGNPNFLSSETETFRATTEAAIISAATPSGVTPGTPQIGNLQAELDAFAPTDLFKAEETPNATDYIYLPDS